jgi:hypothetical protein
MTSKRAAYVKAVLYLILTLIAGFFLVIFFLGGIVGLLLTGDLTLLIGGIFFFALFLIVGTIAKKFEPAWKEFERIKGIRRKTTREAFKESLPSFITIVLALIFAWIFESYFLSFPPNLSPDLAREMLKAILTIDGILIGFFGVVLAQLLWAVHSKGNVIYEQMLAYKEDATAIRELNDEVEILARTKRVIIVSFFYSMMPLLASILLCLSKLPLIDNMEPVSPRRLLFDPLLALIVGIILLAIITFQVDLLPQLKHNKQCTSN